MTVKRTQNPSIPGQIQGSEADNEIVTNNKDPEGSYTRETKNPFSKDVFEAESDFKIRPGQGNVIENINVKYTMFDPGEN